MEKILNTHYKYTLSSLTHKLNVSGHMLIWIFIPIFFLFATRAQIFFFEPFSYTL
jgi:hypothetical protein